MAKRLAVRLFDTTLGVYIFVILYGKCGPWIIAAYLLGAAYGIWLVSTLALIRVNRELVGLKRELEAFEDGHA